MIMDQIGNDPSVLFPSSIGRFILGFEAIETNRNTNDAYKKGIANNLNPMLLISTKIMKLSNDFKNINLEIPQFIFFFGWVCLEVGNRGSTRKGSNVELGFSPVM